MKAVSLVILVLCIGSAVASVPPPPAGVMMTNVSFTSLPASSGVITLHGTLVKPVGDGPFPAVVTISGSGPNDRWEDLEAGIKPFYDIAINLAKLGYAVLTYDKRSCTAGVHPLCQTVPCSPQGLPAGCCNFANMTVDDFASDGASAMNYMLSQSFTKSSGATIIGHSQGCTEAPVAANLVGPAVANVVLLMGSGVSMDALLADQATVQLPLYKEELAKIEKLPPAQQKTLLPIVNGTIHAMECTINYAAKQYDLLRNGVITIADQDDAVVCPMGQYWYKGHGIPTSLYCPAACGTGICMKGKNTPECLARCRLATEISTCMPVAFTLSELEMSSAAGRKHTQTQMTARVLSINSWQDLLVVPATFKPLHAELSALTNLAGLTIHTFYNLTHDMTDIPFTTSTISSKVLTALDEFLA